MPVAALRPQSMAALYLQAAVLVAEGGARHVRAARRRAGQRQDRRGPACRLNSAYRMPTTATKPWTGARRLGDGCLLPLVGSVTASFRRRRTGRGARPARSGQGVASSLLRLEVVEETGVDTGLVGVETLGKDIELVTDQPGQGPRRGSVSGTLSDCRPLLRHGDDAVSVRA